MTVKITYPLSDLLTELNRIFNLFNTKFFENKLEVPVIIVQASRKKRTLGTCSVNRIWLHHKETASDYAKYEISISAEYLNRPIEEICATLLHEMVHLHNGLNNIQDTSNNYVYHNKKFKVESEKRGLLIEHAKTIGWSVTTFPQETKDYIKTLNINEKVFEYYRKCAALMPYISKTELSPKEKLEKLYMRLDRLKEKIKVLEAEG